MLIKLIMAWPWIDAEPYQPAVSCVESRDQGTILETIQPDWNSLSDQDKEAVSLLYQGFDPCAALVYELIRNLNLARQCDDHEDARIRYRNGKRTGRFQELVKLGFLAKPSRDTIGIMQGAQILTHKWAIFLWIDLWEFTVCEEIGFLEEEVRSAVDSLLEWQKFLPFYANLINITSLPHIIPHELGCYRVQSLFTTMQQMIYSGDTLGKALSGKWWVHLLDTEILLLKRLWWLQENADNNTILKEALTETGKRLLDEYERLFPGKGQEIVERSRKSLEKTQQRAKAGFIAERRDAEDWRYWVKEIDYDYT